MNPGITSAAPASACATSARISATRLASTTSHCPRTHSRKSTATWSLRDRAVCSRPAGAPINSRSRLSTFMWMSSSSRENGNPPASISDKTVSSPSRMAAASVSLTMPVAPSIAACARLAAMSSA